MKVSELKEGLAVFGMKDVTGRKDDLVALYVNYQMEA